MTNPMYTMIRRAMRSVLRRVTRAPRQAEAERKVDDGSCYDRQTGRFTFPNCSVVVPTRTWMSTAWARYRF